MTHRIARWALACACAGLLGIPSVADTLELKDGRLLRGTYRGGTTDTVRFDVKGDVQVFHIDEIIALTFTSDSGNGPDQGAPRVNPPMTDPPPGAVDRPPAGSDRPASTSDRPPSASSGTAAPADRYPTSSDRPPSSAPSASAPVYSGGPITVPAGTPVLVRMIDAVDSSVNKVGDKFKASLDTDLVVNGVIVAPKNTDVYGRLTTAESAGHIQGRSELKLELTSIIINNESHTILTGDYTLKGSSRGESSAKRIGAATAGGAILGAIIGGGKGAAVGAGVGAGAATTVQAVTRGEQVKVPSETLLEFKLDQPFTTDPARTAPH